MKRTRKQEFKMSKKNIRNLVIASLSVVAFACGTDDGENNNMNQNMDAGTVVCNIEPNFSSLYDNVFNTVTCNSAGCHGAPESGGLLLTGDKASVHAALLADTTAFAAPQAKRVVANDPDNSYLWTRVNSGATDVMPPSGKMNADCELAMIKTWIENGAAND
jgi:hypothetical protein